MSPRKTLTISLSILVSAMLISSCSDSNNSSQNTTSSQRSISADGKLMVSDKPIANPNTQSTTLPGSQFSNAIPAAPTIDINAAAWALMDYETGEILSEKNMNEPRKPASLTKIMTAYIVAEALKNGSIKFNEKVPVSQKAWKTGGSKMFIKPSDNVTVQDLLQGMIVASGNDATVALAEFLAGSEKTFTSLMNQTAAQLGMKGSHFSNSDGLPAPDQITTAYDMAILARAFIHNYPDVYKLYSQREFTWNGITQHNRNKLLDMNSYADGMKTGHTQAAGYNLVASTLKDNERLISVVMGAPSDQMRAQESNKLLTYGDRFFETITLFSAGAKIEGIKIAGAEDPNQTISLSSKDSIMLTLPKSQISHVEKKLNINQGLSAPIEKGEQIGSIQVVLGSKVLASVPLYSENEVNKAGFFTRMSNKVKSWF